MFEEHDVVAEYSVGQLNGAWREQSESTRERDRTMLITTRGAYQPQ